LKRNFKVINFPNKFLDQYKGLVGEFSNLRERVDGHGKLQTLNLNLTFR
jgi:hypothetical protein